jgi:hypothetical protein
VLERSDAPRVQAELLTASCRKMRTEPLQQHNSSNSDQELLKRAFMHTVHAHKAKAHAYYMARCFENQASPAQPFLRR